MTNASVRNMFAVLSVVAMTTLASGAFVSITRADDGSYIDTFGDNLGYIDTFGSNLGYLDTYGDNLGYIDTYGDVIEDYYGSNPIFAEETYTDEYGVKYSYDSSYDYGYSS